MAIDNAEISLNRPIVETNDTLTFQSRSYFLALDDAIASIRSDVEFQTPLTGSGSPEGVLEALSTKEYMDTAGTAGNIKYIKRDDDIAGDKTMGWILV